MHLRDVSWGSRMCTVCTIKALRHITLHISKATYILNTVSNPSETQRHADCSGVWTFAPLIRTPTHYSTALHASHTDITEQGEILWKESLLIYTHWSIEWCFSLKLCLTEVLQGFPGCTDGDWLLWTSVDSSSFLSNCCCDSALPLSVGVEWGAFVEQDFRLSLSLWLGTNDLILSKLEVANGEICLFLKVIILKCNQCDIQTWISFIRVTSYFPLSQTKCPYIHRRQDTLLPAES